MQNINQLPLGEAKQMLKYNHSLRKQLKVHEILNNKNYDLLWLYAQTYSLVTMLHELYHFLEKGLQNEKFLCTKEDEIFCEQVKSWMGVDFIWGLKDEVFLLAMEVLPKKYFSRIDLHDFYGRFCFLSGFLFTNSEGLVQKAIEKGFITEANIAEAIVFCMQNSKDNNLEILNSYNEQWGKKKVYAL